MFNPLGTSTASTTTATAPLAPPPPPPPPPAPSTGPQLFGGAVQKILGTAPTGSAPAPSPALSPAAPSGGSTASVPGGNPATAQPAGTSSGLTPLTPTPPPPPGPGPDANAGSGPYTPGSVSIGDTVLPNPDPRLTGTQGLVDSAAQGLAGVDRTQLAQSMFDTFAQSTDPVYQAAIRSATRAGAGAGRIGSGMLRTSYGDLANQRDQQLSTAQQQFMEDALQGSIQDQFNKTSALAGLEGQQYGESADTNNQLRTEREYQGSLEQQAFARALAQHQQEQADQSQRYSQALGTASLANGGNPAAVIAAMEKEFPGVDPSVLAEMLGASTGSSITPSKQLGVFTYPSS